MLQFMTVTEQRASRFDPDILIVATLGLEEQFTRDNLTELFMNGVQLPPFVSGMMKEAGIKESSRESAIQRRLGAEPFPYRLHAWGYRQIVEACRQRGIVPVWVYIPNSSQHELPNQFVKLSRAAREAGFLVLDLRNAYRGSAPGAASLADDTIHPGGFGHELLARSLYDALLANAEAVKLSGAAATGKQ